MVDKKKSKKFTLRFDKTQKRAKLKITPQNAEEHWAKRVEKNLKKVWNKIWQIFNLWYIKPYAAKRWEASGGVEIKKFEKSSKQNLTNLQTVLN